jgi:hypothetical protein
VHGAAAVLDFPVERVQETLCALALASTAEEVEPRGGPARRVKKISCGGVFMRGAQLLCFPLSVFM